MICAVLGTDNTYSIGETTSLFIQNVYFSIQFTNLQIIAYLA